MINSIIILLGNMSSELKILFVAVPLPGTGVWSGALLANLLDLRFSQSSIAIIVGNLIAGILITVISTGIFHFAF